MANEIAIIGGGPAGIVAAITAKRLGASVTVFEASDRIGKKILATGNGKCNLSNSGELLRAYNAPEFVAPVLARFDYAKTVDFFKRIC